MVVEKELETPDRKVGGFCFGYFGNISVAFPVRPIFDWVTIKAIGKRHLYADKF